MLPLPVVGGSAFTPHHVGFCKLLPCPHSMMAGDPSGDPRHREGAPVWVPPKEFSLTFLYLTAMQSMLLRLEVSMLGMNSLKRAAGGVAEAGCHHVYTDLS